MKVFSIIFQKNYSNVNQYDKKKYTKYKHLSKKTQLIPKKDSFFKNSNILHFIISLKSYIKLMKKKLNIND